jgi:two-component system response regulator
MPDDKLILLVEDNVDDERLTLRALLRNRIQNQVRVVRDGAEALDFLFRAENPLPQVVLLDLNLPKIGGLDVLRRVRANERTKILPVVILTSSKEEEDLVQSYSSGANAYVRKPVEFAAFREAVAALGMFWLLVNEGPPRKKREP